MRKSEMKQKLSDVCHCMALTYHILMSAIESLNILTEEFMDKKIKKVKKSMDKKMDSLVAMDKPRDKKLKKCSKIMKSKKKA